MKTKILLLIAGVLALFNLPAVSALERVRMGLGSVSALHGAIWIAEEKRIFQQHGIEPEIIVIGGGGPLGMSALIAGDVQFTSGAGDAVISAALRGADVVMAAAILNRGVQRVMARPELRSHADLVGKKVGVTRFGAVSHLVLQMMLRKWGMGPGKVQIIQVGSSPAMLASLDKGGIDAAVLTIPTVFVAEERGFRVLADLADMDIYYLHNMLDTTRRYLRTHRDQATRFIKAYVEGIAYFKKNRKESLEVLRKKLRIGPGQESHLERSYDLLAAKYYEPVPYPSLKGAETVLEFMAKDNPRAKEADPRSFIDDSIVREIEASGFIKALYEK